MSSRDSGEDDDQEQGRQGHHRRRWGAHESAADIVLHVQRQGTQVETIPRTESQTIHAYRLPVGQVTGFASTHTQTEADRPISTPTNANQEGHFPHSSASNPDEPTTVEGNPTVAVPKQAGLVKQEDHPPVAAVQPQPAYNLADIYGHGVLTRGPIPPPRWLPVRGARRGFARVPISLDRIGSGLRTILRQADMHFVGQARQVFPRDPPGNLRDAPRREATRPVVVVVAPGGDWLEQEVLASAGTAAGAQQREVQQLAGPSQQYTRPPNAADTQQAVDEEQTTASIPTPPEAERLLTPATEAATVQHYEPDTTNPVQQQELDLAELQDSNPPTEHYINLEQAGANCGSPKPSTSFSGEDLKGATISRVCYGIRAEHNPNEEREISLHQMPRASPSTSDILPLAQSPETVLPVTTVAERHGTNYPTSATLPPQQLNAVKTERSRFQCANPTGTFTQEKSTQVNIGLEQQEDGPDHNENNAQRANTGSYNDLGTSSQMPSTAEDGHEVTRRDNSRERLMAEAAKIFRRNVPDPKLRSVLAPVSRLLFSDWTPRDDTEAQQLERSLKCVEYLMTKEREGSTGRRCASRSEDGGEARAAGRADTRGGDRPIGRHPLARGRQDSPQPGGNSGAARCSAPGGSGPAAVSPQQLATAGGRKRRSDPKAVAPPAAKRKRVVCHLETEVQCTRTEGEDGGVRADGPYVTAIAGEQQVAEEQENDSPLDVHRADEEVSVIHENTRGDGALRIFIQHELAMGHRYAPVVGPTTSDGTQQLQIRHGTRRGREFKVLKQYAEGTNTSNVQPSGSVGNRYEEFATVGNIPSSGAPGTSMTPMMDGQEEITIEKCVVCRLIKKEEADSDDNDVVEVSNNLNEETENEHEPAGIEDNSSRKMVIPDAEDEYVGNDIDLNVPAENKSDQHNDAASVEEYNAAEIKEEHERYSPIEGMAHNSDDDDDDVIFLYGNDTYTL